MPTISTPEQSNIITWKVISTGTAIVVALFVIFWLARTAASERALAEQQRLDEMAAESRAVCAKWGMPFGSPKYAGCAADIETLRAKHERRIADALDGF
ncbi:MAG TPA: hypothetical protein VFB29_12770 [Pseudolabrys sp.]|nr:hypothetical protein [Pseudolabrys sp.]